MAQVVAGRAPDRAVSMEMSAAVVREGVSELGLFGLLSRPKVAAVFDVYQLAMFRTAFVAFNGVVDKEARIAREYEGNGGYDGKSHHFRQKAVKLGK